jgi:hypothetical protein
MVVMPLIAFGGIDLIIRLGAGTMVMVTAMFGVMVLTITDGIDPYGWTLAGVGAGIHHIIMVVITILIIVRLFIIMVIMAVTTMADH